MPQLETPGQPCAVAPGAIRSDTYILPPFTGDVFREVRERPIVPLLQHFGTRRKGKLWGCCTHEDKNPSVYISKDGAKAICPVCNVAMSSIDWAKVVLRCSTVDALQTVAGVHGIPIADHKLTGAQRRDYGQQRAADALDAPAAAWWQGAAVELFEEILASMTSTDPERQPVTQCLTELRGANGRALLTIYRSWREQNPERAAALVEIGRRRAEELQTWLAECVVGMEAA
jgi:hypothetical protein